MCATCGCSGTAQILYTDPETGKKLATPRVSTGGHLHAQRKMPIGVKGPAHGTIRFRPLTQSPADHAHEQEHAHPALHAAREPHTIALEQEILAKNQGLAERNRGWLLGRDILALNLMSSPGAGKTTLLERTIRDLADLKISVVEGDQATINDAERIRATGAKVIQINTGTGCHLEADMLARALQQLQPPQNSMVMIENVGNLVCPALFDLGERAKVVILSVTEGEDKPIKYPHMFRASDVMLLNKVDLLPYLRFDVERCIGYACEVNPRIRVIRTSATSGEGMDEWYAWLRAQAVTSGLLPSAAGAPAQTETATS